MWGEPRPKLASRRGIYISTHSPRVGRTLQKVAQVGFAVISTHSPRVGRTFLIFVLLGAPLNFNSLAPCGANLHRYSLPLYNAQFQLTRPVWGEPRSEIRYSTSAEISTHSPRVGRTANAAASRSLPIISTHSPRVGRTLACGVIHARPEISTHSPRVGRTGRQDSI